MKKHELIKAAYDNFPKGSKFHWGGFPITSTGEFHFNDETIVTSGSDTEYQVFDGKKFAKLVNESILSGKCAIQVDNPKECEYVNNYNNTTWNPAINYGFPAYLYLTDGRGFDTDVDVVKHNGYKIIPFQDFAAAVGIEVPEFVITSEDGIPLYVGDDYHRAWYSIDVYKEWRLDHCKDLRTFHTVVTGVDKAKAFSTKEAAEKWCNEMNKPKSVNIDLFNSGSSAQVSKDVIMLNIDGYHLGIKPSDLEDIIAAYKSLQS